MLQDVTLSLWMVTIAAVAAFAWIAFVDLPRWRKRMRVPVTLKRMLLWGGAVCLAGWAMEIWSNGSGAAHVLTSGAVQRVKQQFYHAGREGMIACVEDCRTTLLNFDPDATEAVKDNSPGTVLKIAYLDRRKEISSRTYGYDVVDIWDAQTGQNLFHVDTGAHPQRLLLLIADAMLLLVGASLCARMSRTEPDPEEEAEPEPTLAVPQLRRRHWRAIRHAAAREGADRAD